MSLALGAQLARVTLQALLGSLTRLPGTELLHLGLAGARSRMLFGADPLARTLTWNL